MWSAHDNVMLICTLSMLSEMEVLEDGHLRNICLPISDEEHARTARIGMTISNLTFRLPLSITFP